MSFHPPLPIDLCPPPPPPPPSSSSSSSSTEEDPLIVIPGSTPVHRTLYETNDETHYQPPFNSFDSFSSSIQTSLIQRPDIIQAISVVTQWDAQPHHTAARINQLSFLLESYKQQQTVASVPPPPPPHSNQLQSQSPSQSPSQSSLQSPSQSSSQSSPHLNRIRGRYFSTSNPSEGTPKMAPNLFCLDSVGNGNKMRPVVAQSTRQSDDEEELMINIQDGSESARSTQARKDIKALCERMQWKRESSEDDISRKSSRRGSFSNMTWKNSDQEEPSAKRRRPLLTVTKEDEEESREAKIVSGDPELNGVSTERFKRRSANVESIVGTRNHSDRIICPERLDTNADMSSDPRAQSVVEGDVASLSSLSDSSGSSDEDGTASPIPVTAIVNSIVNSVKSLRPEEVDREMVWSLWGLQESLGDRFPSSLKSINEPKVNNRPLHVVRYTSTEDDLRIKLPSDFWSSKNEIYDADGNVMINSDELHQIRTALKFPLLTPPNVPPLDKTPGRIESRFEFCKLCGHPDCEAKTARFGCQRSRCARCYQSGHGVRRCRQPDPNMWCYHYLNHLDSSYKKSLNSGMCSSAVPQFKPCCITCGNEGHSFCGYRIEDSRPEGSFKIISREEIVRVLKTPYSNIRWDFEASAWQQSPIAQMPCTRYSIRDWNHRQAVETRYRHGNSHEVGQVVGSRPYVILPPPPPPPPRGGGYNIHVPY